MYDEYNNVNQPGTVNAKFKSILLPEGTDLNDVVTPGLYYNKWNSVVETMRNVPEKLAFSLFVEETSGVKQTFTTFPNDYFSTYQRQFYGDVWGAWKLVENSTVLYENDAGSNGTITLSGNASRYKYLDIYYKDDWAFKNSATLTNLNQNVIQLNSIRAPSNNFTFFSRMVYVYGSTIATYENYHSYYTPPNATGASNGIYIYKVVGRM